MGASMGASMGAWVPTSIRGALFPTPKQVPAYGAPNLGHNLHATHHGYPLHRVQMIPKMSSLFESGAPSGYHMGAPCGYPYARRALRSTKCDR